MPTEKNSNDNDKERRRSSGGSRSLGRQQSQGYAYGRSLDRDLPYEVEKVVDQLDDMIFGYKPTRQCDDTEPRPSDDGHLAYGKAAELMADRLKEAFVQQFVNVPEAFVQQFVNVDDPSPSALSDDVTNDILPDETFDRERTFDTFSSISEKVSAPRRTSAKMLPREMGPLPEKQSRRMRGNPLAMLKRLSRSSLVDNDAEATAAATINKAEANSAATISHTSMENRPALIVQAVDYNKNVANVNDEGKGDEEHDMIVEQVDYGIEKRSFFNRRIKGNAAKDEVVSYKRNEDDDKGEEDVEADAEGNIGVHDEPSASPTKVSKDVEGGCEESVSDSKKKKKRRVACLLVTACMLIILIIILGSTQKRSSKQKAADFSGGEPRSFPVPPTYLSSSAPTFKPSTAPVLGASVSVEQTPLPTADKPVSASPTDSTSIEDEVVDEKTENIENRPADEESDGTITFDANQPSGEDDVPTLTNENGFVQDAIGTAPVATPSGVPTTVRPTALPSSTEPTPGPSASPVSSSPTKRPSASPVSGSPTATPVSDPLTPPIVDPAPVAEPAFSVTDANFDGGEAAFPPKPAPVEEEEEQVFCAADVFICSEDPFVSVSRDPANGCAFPPCPPKKPAESEVGSSVDPVSDPPTAAPVTPEPSSAPVSDPPTEAPVSDLPTAAPVTSKSSTGPTSAPVTNGEDALARTSDDVSDGSTTDTNIGIAEVDATGEKAKKGKKSEKVEKTEKIENKGEEVEKKDKKKGEKSEKGEDVDDINTKAETHATKDPSPEPTSALVSDPPTASPVSDPPTADSVTPEPSSAPVSDPPTTAPVSDPPTAAPTSSPSTSPTSNPTSLPTPLPIIWEESSPGHLVTNNNRDKATDGIMFSVTAKASTITITSIDILLDSIDTNVPVDVMIMQGPYFGYELYSRAWDAVGSYTIPQGNGPSRVTAIQGLDPITIASGETIGLYILFPEGHEMLIGSAGEITSDGNIRIYSGSSVPAKFMSVERGVGWSGAIEYSIVEE